MHDLTALPLFATGNDVTDMIVDGKLIMRDRSVLTLDEQEILARAEALEPAVTERLAKFVSRWR